MAHLLLGAGVQGPVQEYLVYSQRIGFTSPGRELLCERLGVHRQMLPPEGAGRMGKAQHHHWQAEEPKTNSGFFCISSQNTFLWAK